MQVGIIPKIEDAQFYRLMRARGKLSSASVQRMISRRSRNFILTPTCTLLSSDERSFAARTQQTNPKTSMRMEEFN